METRVTQQQNLFVQLYQSKLTLQSFATRKLNHPISTKIAVERSV